jgi:hypothetical protein
MAKLLKTLEVYRDEVWCHDINLYEITSWLSPKGSKKNQMGRKLPCMLDSSSCKISFFAPSFSMRGISIHDRQLVLITSILRSAHMPNVLLHMHIFHMPGCLYIHECDQPHPCNWGMQSGTQLDLSCLHWSTNLNTDSLSKIEKKEETQIQIPGCSPKRKGS